MGYLSISDFTKRTIMPSGDIVRLDQTWLQTTLDDTSEFIDDQLRKRYAVPFAAPVPRIVLRWLTAIVTERCYAKRGWNPASEQDNDSIAGDMKTAKDELQKAADAVTGLFELPLRADGNDVSGVSKGGPLSSGDQSPYAWMDHQRDAAGEGRDQ